MHTPDGYASSKLTGTLLERRLGVVSTTRNWNTVTKLCRARRRLTAAGPMDVVAVDWSGARPGCADAHLAGPRRRRGARRSAQRPHPSGGGRRPGRPARPHSRRPGGRAGLLVLVPGLVPARAVLRHRRRPLGDGRAGGRELAGRVRPPVLGAPRAAAARAARRTSAGPSGPSRSAASAPRARSRSGAPARSGTGSIRGMPHLRRLRAAGFQHLALRSALALDGARDLPPPAAPGRSTRAAASSGPATSPRRPGRSPRPFATSIVDSEDAFDAAISALVMDEPPGRPGLAAPVHRSGHAAGGRRVASS